LHALAADLLETMQAAQGAGLAAPQIGVDLQLVVFGFESSARYPGATPVPRAMLLNPVIGSDQEPGRCWASCTCDVHGIRLNADSEAACKPPEPTRTAPDGPAQRGERCLRCASGPSQLGIGPVVMWAGVFEIPMRRTQKEKADPKVHTHQVLGWIQSARVGARASN
jgi:hypothetical protein